MRVSAVLFRMCGQRGEASVPGAELPGQDRLIADFYTDKSAYRPGDEVRFTLELKNETQEEFKEKSNLPGTT